VGGQQGNLRVDGCLDEGSVPEPAENCISKTLGWRPPAFSHEVSKRFCDFLGRSHPPCTYYRDGAQSQLAPRFSPYIWIDGEDANLKMDYVSKHDITTWVL
jgi:hypothetical protein